MPRRSFRFMAPTASEAASAMSALRIFARAGSRRIGSIGQLINVKNFMLALGQQETKSAQSDEATPVSGSFLCRHDQATCVSGVMLVGKSSGAT